MHSTKNKEAAKREEQRKKKKIKFERLSHAISLANRYKYFFLFKVHKRERDEVLNWSTCCEKHYITTFAVKKVAIIGHSLGVKHYNMHVHTKYTERAMK